MQYDVVIVGASFAGLTLGHYLPRDLRILILDAKPEAGSSVESTGLITVKTREEFRDFLDIDKYITNPIRTICVVAPNYDNFFFSHTASPWIYQTDTKALVKHMADTLPANVTLRTSTAFANVDDVDCVQNVKIISQGKSETISTRFLVGADGAQSKVAGVIPALDKNKEFLFGHEQVFFGDVHLGSCPEDTIYHFWFGEFSLGYGGWLSPTIVNGKKAFRIGLAKLSKDRHLAQGLMKQFIQILLDRGIITIEGDIDEPGYLFSGIIPIGGTLKKIHHGNVLLLGNAAGFCGAFAADGIKGSVISGKEAAKIIPEYLSEKAEKGGDFSALAKLKSLMNRHNFFMHYLDRQVRYRFVWDLMKSNRTFRAMYDIIEREKETFVDQFCDAKDKRKSLTRVVLKWKHIPALVRYAWCIFLDLFRAV